ncbi:hypothetical protein DIPPA_16384 [Diplonema papillatum]|nr:hypothetical protein DIPPA_16384 [Diplonema papillatum]
MRDDLLTEWSRTSTGGAKSKEPAKAAWRSCKRRWGSEEVVIQVKAWSTQGSRDIARLQAPIPRDFCAKDSESYRLSFLRGTNLAAGYVTLQIASRHALFK